MRLRTVSLLLAVCLTAVRSYSADRPFHIMEASIADIHAAMQSGTLTCHSLVQQYLDRIQAYDQQGPAINAMFYLNPRAVEQADAMDR